MFNMFKSATLKLTGWYLLILMIISLLFSIIIYEISITELNARLGYFESQIERSNGQLSGKPSEYRQHEVQKANVNLFFALLYTNAIVLIVGGVASHFAARLTLRPIEEVHEAQSRFTSDASHELRTPLAVMKSELEVALRDTSLSKSEMRELLESNLEEVDRLSELSRTLLQISRHEYAELEVKRLNLSSTVSEIVKAHNLSSKRLNSTIEKNVFIDANSSSLKELMMILLDNALRYSPTTSCIKLALTSNRNDAKITILNKGDPISRTDLPHIFERFYRGDKSRKSGSANGFGLGLSLAKKIVDLHAGEITITSSAKRGTLVTLTFKKV